MPEAGHILIADDDKVSLSLTAGLLEKHGYTCTCVGDGTSAQERLQNTRYDLVISDIKMPGNFDLDLIKALAQPAFNIPVIVVTAYPSLHSALQSIQLSVAGYLRKPFVPDELLTQVRTAIANKRAEKALHESEERYRNLFDHASDALATVTLDGTITRTNRSFALLLGYSPQEPQELQEEELLGQPYHTFIAPASIPQAKQEALRVLNQNALPQTCELELLHKNGSLVPVEAHNCVISGPDGTPIGFQGSYRDISARKALERQRAELLAMLTHDICNPLGVILGYTQMLLEGIHEQEPEQEPEQEDAESEGAATAEMNAHILERILCNTLTVHSLVANYLDLSKIEAGQLSIAKHPVQLNTILEQVSTKYETAARNANVQLSLHLQNEQNEQAGQNEQNELPMITGDALALERVFANLVSNALKFTPEGGQVTLSTTQHDGSVVATVTDTGSGMRQEEIPSLFEKYRRAKKDHSKEGIGLGLFIVKTLVNQHEGRIQVESTPGQGSCFQLFFPSREQGGQNKQAA